jgi:hypothetical protein
MTNQCRRETEKRTDLLNLPMNQTAKITETGTAANRERRGRFSLRFCHHKSISQPHHFPGGG